MNPFPFLRQAGLLALACCAFLSARATHIVGGQLQMTYQSAGQYQLSLSLYFDAVNGTFGARQQSLRIYFYAQRTHQLQDSVTLPLTTTTPVAYSRADCQRPSLQTDILRYVSTVPLDPARYADPAGYYIAWERCCRNGVITNIQQPGSAAQVFYLEFPALLRDGQPFVNSSPAGFAATSDYACAGVPFRTAFGGTDPDGDSLVYDLVTPLNGHARSQPNRLVEPRPARPGPYEKVQWLPGFDSLHQITGPQPLTVNRQTGELTFTAGQPGLYVFAVRCTEYRAGRRLGELRREFQQVVISCPPNPAPDLSLTLPGPPRHSPLYVPGTVLQLPDPPASRCLNLYAVDGDNNSPLTLSVISAPHQPPTPLPALSVTHGTVNPNGRRDTLIATLCFDECFNPQGALLRLGLIAEDQACPHPNRDTLWLTVQSRPIDTTFLHPPNIFTPNQDGLNDDFSPAAGIVPHCGQRFRRLRIFNRWGREVFSSPDRLARWTGADLSAGQYFYFLEYSDRTYKGWVELAR